MQLPVYCWSGNALIIRAHSLFSDPALREFILLLDEKHQFGVIALDDTHLLLLAEETVIDFIQQELDKMQEEYA